MHQERQGIFRLNGELAIPQAPTLVVVHPWFGLGKSPSPDYCLYDSDTGRVRPISPSPYLRNIDRLLRDHRGEVIVLEEEKKVEDTRGRLAQMPETRGRFIVLTKEEDPRLLNSSFANIARFAGRYGPEILMAGGYISGAQTSGSLAGCLGFVYDSFSLAGLQPKLVEGCCFTFLL